MAEFKIFAKALAIFVLLQVVNSNVISQPNDEHRIIQEFCNYVNKISRIKEDHVLDKLIDVVRKLLEAIPVKDRVYSADMLQKLIEDPKGVEHSRSYEEKKAILLDLQQLVAKQMVEKQESSALITQLGISGMFEVLKHASEEDREFREEFVLGADKLSEKLSPEGKQRHAALFDVINEYKAIENISRTEEIMERFNKLKDYYLGQQ